MKAMLEKEEAGAAAVNGNIKATPTVSGEASVTTTSDALIPPKQGKIVHKPLLQPQWVDDFKMPDLMFGRGKGKPKEDPPPLQFQLKGISNDSTAVNSHSSAGPHQPAPPKMLPKATENMSSGQKVAVELIAKARNKALSPEEAVKPLSKIEMNLLKR